MLIRELAVPDCFEITPVQFPDDRGTFLEWYRFDVLEEAVGHPLDLRQANLSVSGSGVFRGLHFTKAPPGQAKYVTVPRGAVLDFAVDIRIGSPAFGTVDAVRLDDRDRKAVYLAEGVAHGFLALEDDTTVAYLVNSVYDPSADRDLNPLDPAIGLDLPIPADRLRLSDKDRAAPTLAELEAEGVLPSWAELREYTAALAAKAGG